MNSNRNYREFMAKINEESERLAQSFKLPEEEEEKEENKENRNRNNQNFNENLNEFKSYGEYEEEERENLRRFYRDNNIPGNFMFNGNIIMRKINEQFENVDPYLFRLYYGDYYY